MNRAERTSELKAALDALRDIKVPSQWTWERVAEYIDGLFSFAKFKPGYHVVMAKTYPVDEQTSWGWMSCRHLLREGQGAVVDEVDYYNGRFVYSIVFDERSWIDRDGVVHTTDRPTRLRLSEEWLQNK